MSLTSSLPVHSGGLFRWVGNEGSADISDLGPNPVGLLEGSLKSFIVASPQTGRLLLFSQFKVVRDREQDITEWVYRSLGEVNQNGIIQNSKFTVTLYND